MPTGGNFDRVILSSWTTRFFLLHYDYHAACISPPSLCTSLCGISVHVSHRIHLIEPHYSCHFLFFFQIMLPYWIGLRLVTMPFQMIVHCCCFTWVSRRFSERSDLAVILYMYSIVE